MPRKRMLWPPPQMFPLHMPKKELAKDQNPPQLLDTGPSTALNCSLTSLSRWFSGLFGRVLVGLVYSTTFKHKLDNTTTYKAYEMIQEWVRTQGGKVKENHRPTLVVAVFGSSSSKLKPWEKRSRRTMRFELTQLDSQLHVKVHVSSSLLKDSDVTSHGDEARFNWSQTLTTLWTRFGQTGAEEETRTSPPPAAWTRAMGTG